MKAARLMAARAHHRREPRCPVVMLAEPVLADPVLADPVLADPVLADPGLADPVLADTANVLSPKTHVRRTCMAYLYDVHVRCTSWLVRRIVVK